MTESWKSQGVTSAIFYWSSKSLKPYQIQGEGRKRFHLLMRKWYELIWRERIDGGHLGDKLPNWCWKELSRRIGVDSRKWSWGSGLHSKKKKNGRNFKSRKAERLINQWFECSFQVFLTSPAFLLHASIRLNLFYLPRLDYVPNLFSQG